MLQTIPNKSRDCSLIDFRADLIEAAHIGALQTLQAQSRPTSSAGLGQCREIIRLESNWPEGAVEQAKRTYRLQFS
jgi:hypothetical protein